jgi:hypothetical protein
MIASIETEEDNVEVPSVSLSLNGKKKLMGGEDG